MSNEQLDALIEELNSNPRPSKFLLTKISENVFWGKVWHSLPWIKTSQYFGENYYFIQSSNLLFIGVIEASVSEMHVYLKPEYREEGTMSNTLREIIIPHMLYMSETEQLRITIDKDFHGKKFEKIERSAQLAGFKGKKEIGDRIFEYTANKSDFKTIHFQRVKEQQFSEDEFSFLYERINSINAQLQYMKERFEIFFNEEEQLISNIKDDVRYFENEYDKKLRSRI